MTILSLMSVNVNIDITKRSAFSLCRYVHALMLLLCHYVRMFTLQTYRSVLLMSLCREGKLGLNLCLSYLNVIGVLQEHWRTTKWIPFVKQRLFVYLFVYFITCSRAIFYGV